MPLLVPAPDMAARPSQPDKRKEHRLRKMLDVADGMLKQLKQSGQGVDAVRKQGAGEIGCA